MLPLRSMPIVLCAAGLLLTAAHADTPAAKPAVPAAASAKPADSDEAKTYPAQASVAAKGTFGTVAASDKSVTVALDAKALADAKKLAGKPGSFQ